MNMCRKSKDRAQRRFFCQFFWKKNRRQKIFLRLVRMRLIPSSPVLWCMPTIGRPFLEKDLKLFVTPRLHSKDGRIYSSNSPTQLVASCPATTTDNTSSS